ncbi:MAG: galT 1 [Verrucomicrobia bacterium]|nr:galT 1 [Verrucomicrobiota bacterium]
MPPPVVWQQRWHPLREEWVLFTSHRRGRPWIGDTHRPADLPVPHYDPTCALCPGNKRLRGANPPYAGVYWFTNDLPCFSAEAPSAGGDDFYQTRPAGGTAEVICYSPDHAKTFVDLTDAECAAVVDLWAERSVALAARAEVDHVLIFENKGALVGTSNPHPHCQVYAGNLIYGFIAREAESARKFWEKTGRTLGAEILAREAAGPRVIAQDGDWLACVPWFARYAYEVFLLPKREVGRLGDLRQDERASLGRMVREVATRYDNLWRLPMPYVMAVHQAPCDGADHAFYPFHLEFHPPLRKPDTMKYLAGPEIGGGSMTNESNPDEKAAELRAVPSVHYKRLG